MAIRSRIKSKIKSLLFGAKANSSNGTNSNGEDQTSSTVSKTTFVPPNVSTQASNNNASTRSVNVEEKHIDTTPTVSDTLNEIVSDGSSAATTEQTADEEQSHIDDAEATFIIDIEELFPATCPHCGASSHNNWIRIENKFACGSCETAY